MIRIITDSSSEILPEEAEKFGIEIVPLNISFGSESYCENSDITKDEFYTRLCAREFPKTSQPSTETFAEIFKKMNGEETLVILIASALSGCINAAKIAKRDGNFENIHIYDSSCITCMLRILVETACANRDKSVEEVVAILDGLRPRIRLYAELDSLDHLARGGRISHTVAFIGGILNIKPIIQINAEGKVELVGKAKGQKKAVSAVAEFLNRDGADENYPVYYLQTNADEPVDKLKQETYRPDARKFRINCALGTHIGPNAAGVVYVKR